MNTIPEVMWGSVKCNACRGTGWYRGYWEQEEIVDCPKCEGQGEIVDVVEVRDGKEVIEDE